MKNKKSLGRTIGKAVFAITLLTIIVLVVCSYASTKRLLTQRNQLAQQSAAESLMNSNNSFRSSTQKELSRLTSESAFNGKNSMIAKSSSFCVMLKMLMLKSSIVVLQLLMDII
ncbi:hypothetical protein [Liquorilactobacillus nagelii]|uniref:hypothetical protein n=1 Tax=Liquorilactobacillus nagelii TaxID=82688 RepID=UPI001F15DBBA|nr:hypothetical protein [Liquorilactobacillus nagelii]